MQNELCRIGQLIFDLKRNVNFDPGQENFDFITEEFRRITLSLGVQWDKKVKGLPYLLEFHKEETVRLSDIVDELRVGAMLHKRHNIFLESVYRQLESQLAELLSRIELMIAHKTDFNVN